MREEREARSERDVLNEVLVSLFSLDFDFE